MYIQETIYSMANNMYEIYVAGCKPKMICGNEQHCPGCHNYELWKFREEDNTKSYKSLIEENIKMFDDIIDYVAILGGDPLDQDLEKIKFLTNIIKSFNKKVIIFTGYDIEYAKTLDIDFDYIKCGYFDENNTNKVFNKTIGLELIGDNQKVYDNNYNLVE